MAYNHRPPCHLRHKEVGLNEADFFFVTGLAHHEHDIGLFFGFTEGYVLCFQKELQIALQAEAAFPVLSAGVRVNAPSYGLTIENQAAILNVNVTVVETEAVASKVVFEEAVCLAVKLGVLVFFAYFSACFIALACVFI